MDPSTLLIPLNTPVLNPNGKMNDEWWRYFEQIVTGLGDIDLTTQVTGILPVANGGTGTSVPLVLKHQRVTTGTITAGTSALVTLTWTAAFSSANYTVTASVFDATAATASLSVVHVEQQTSTLIKVRVVNNAAGDLAGTLEALAVGD